MRVRFMRVLGRRRRLLAAILAAAAAACALLSIQPPPGVAVLAAARDLTGGRLSAADITPIRLPASAVPDGALREGAKVAGRVLGGPMRKGEPLTDVRLLGPSMLSAYGPGLVATPVRIADGEAARLLSPGDVVDIFGSDAEGVQASVVAAEVPIVARPGVGDPSQGALLVLATTPGQAAQLAQAQAGGHLSFAVHFR
ncbi:flagellar biosynthesis protein FlgA [Streptosporangiaceae bacterium NEAU-GS5]|nr:flagellar biosynthesis protein FlgA [Streptosporangiaceae bacterium NEAU-GS5]